MVKNKLEKKFSESLRNDNDFWGMKLHNNPLAHQNTPADYILSHIETITFSEKNFAIKRLKLLLVECKQVTCDCGKGRLAFKRLKQMHDLIAFENQNEFHRSYFCIAFYDERWDKSEVYLIPVKQMQLVVDTFLNVANRVSINRTIAKEQFQDYRCPFKGKYIDLQQLK